MHSSMAAVCMQQEERAQQHGSSVYAARGTCITAWQQCVYCISCEYSPCSSWRDTHSLNGVQCTVLRLYSSMILLCSNTPDPCSSVCASPRHNGLTPPYRGREANSCQPNQHPSGPPATRHQREVQGGSGLELAEASSAGLQLGDQTWWL